MVKHNGLVYRAESLITSAEPGNKIHEYFYVSNFYPIADIVNLPFFKNYFAIFLVYSVVSPNQDL